MIDDFPLIHKEPPRNQREVMKEILNEARLDPAEAARPYCCDDDDAISVDFIESCAKPHRIARLLLKQHKTVLD
jgi:hypothetical protein